MTDALFTDVNLNVASIESRAKDPAGYLPAFAIITFGNGFLS